MTLLPTVARRPLTLSARRLGGLAAGCVALALLVLPWRPETLCPLRALTGVPCPFCGSTTAAVAAGHLDPAGALRANPFTVIGLAAWAAAPVALRVPRIAAAVAALRRRVTGRRAAVAVLVLVAAAEAYQLARLGAG